MLRCPYCSAQISASYTTCPSCSRPLAGAAPGWANPAATPNPSPQGWPAPAQSPYPISPAAAQVQQFAALLGGRASPAAQVGPEKRHHWIWIGNLITIGVAGWLIYENLHGSPGLLGLGIGMLALAALSLWLSRFGARWKRTSCLEKLLILPGVLVGLVVLAALVLGGSESSSDKGSDSGGDSGGNSGGDSGGGESSSERRKRVAEQLPQQPCPYCGQMTPTILPVCVHCRQRLR